MKKLNLSSDSMEPFFQKIGDLTRVQRILISAGAVVVIVAVFGFFFYKPKLDELSRLSQDIENVEQKLVRVKRSASQYAKYKKEMEDARSQFMIASRALPNTEEIPSLLTSISQAGKTSGLDFLLFQPNSESKKDFYAEIPIRMELSGTYHELGTFFDKLARLSRIVNINNCTTDGQGGSVLKITCTAATYKFIEGAESDKSKKPKKKKR